MSLSLTLACVWALACTVVAFLPLRYQYAPGLSLLIALPALLVFVGIQHGPWVPLVVLVAAVSLFRRPLAHLYRYVKRRLK